MSNREKLVEILQTSKGMIRKDAEAFVIAIDEYQRKAQQKSRISENMTGAARGAFGENAEQVVDLIMKVIDEAAKNR